MRINEFISEFLMNVPIKVKLSNSENVDGSFVKKVHDLQYLFSNLQYKCFFK